MAILTICCLLRKTAKTLDEAIKFKVALEMLDSGERISYHVMIDTHDAYTYLMTEQAEEKQDKVVNIK
jgi:hypothetical protein